MSWRGKKAGLSPLSLGSQRPPGTQCAAARSVATALEVHCPILRERRSNMRPRIPAPHRNTSPNLPLFEAADRLTVRALPLPAHHLARRHNIPSATACMVAEAAGFALEARR